jgi:hypothetical protein
MAGLQMNKNKLLEKMGLKKKPTISTLQKIRDKIQITLPVAVCIVLIMASVIVATGYALYLRSDNQKYDLARPGQKQDNKALDIEDTDADTTSPVDAPVTKRKIEYLDKEIGALKSMTDFNQADLSDQDIQLSPAEQPSR